MNLLGSNLYDPSVAVSKATSALLAMTAVDTTNLRIALTVPAHGKVRFRLACTITGATTFPTILLGVINGATVVGRVSPIVYQGTASGATTTATAVAEFVANGLTPGALNADAAYGVEALVALTNIKYGGPNNTTGADAWGAFVFEAWDPQPNPTNFGLTSIDASGRVDVGKVTGTAQTARDLGFALPAVASGLAGGLPVLDNGLGVNANVIHASTAQAGGAATITLAAITASTVDSFYNGTVIGITAGTGGGQARVITGYVGATKVATVGRNWVTNPDATSVYKVYALDKPRVDSNLAVIVQTGTGTGQLDFTSGVIKANLAQILGTALTETAGLLAGGFKQFFNIATPTGTVNSLPNAVPGAAGGLLVDDVWTDARAAKLDNLDATISGRMATYTQPAGFLAATFPATIASPTNITAGTITTATNLTTNNDKTGYGLSAAAVQAVWDALTSALTTAGSIGKRIADFLTGDSYVRLGAPAGASHAADIASVKTSVGAVTGAVGSVTGNVGGNVVGSVASVTADVGITQGGADKVWLTTTRALTDKIAFVLSSAGVQAIWDAATSALTSIGSIGKLLVTDIDATISSRGTSTYAGGDTSGTTTLLSRLSSGRATGLDNLDATVSSRSTYAGGAVASVTADVGITQAGADKVWGTTVRSLSTFGTLVADTTTAVWAAATRTLTVVADSAGITTLLTRLPSALTITTGKVDVNDKTGFALTAAYDLAKTALQTGGSVIATNMRGTDSALLAVDYTAPPGTETNAELITMEKALRTAAMSDPKSAPALFALRQRMIAKGIPIT
jgi:hypothetical protein